MLVVLVNKIDHYFGLACHRFGYKPTQRFGDTSGWIVAILVVSQTTTGYPRHFGCCHVHSALADCRVNVLSLVCFRMRLQIPSQWPARRVRLPVKADMAGEETQPPRVQAGTCLLLRMSLSCWETLTRWRRRRGRSCLETTSRGQFTHSTCHNWSCDALCIRSSLVHWSL